MATQRYDKTQLGLYVERAVADESGNRFFASDPLELHVYIKYEGTVDDVVSISGTCRGATRNAGGSGSIIAYHIEGLEHTENIAWGYVSQASGVVLPIERQQSNGFSSRVRHAKVQDVAYLSRGVDAGVIDVSSVDSAPVTRARTSATATIKIGTTKHPMQVGTYNGSDGPVRLDFEPTERSQTAGNRYQFDHGSILFEDFVFYGNYAYQS